ncbi:MAG: transcription elongation factor GreB [Pseudomonadota bacterium]
MSSSSEAAAAPPNYITTQGYNRLLRELEFLVRKERPEVTQIVSWAASNGDRSENGDYLYGKRRLREIDRRIRFLTKRLEKVQVIDPTVHHGKDQVFFGASVTYLRNGASEEAVRIVGIDEVDPAKRHVSWISPIARALLKAREGDQVRLQTPSGTDSLEVLSVSYEST